jgi:hypothetical protein
VALFRASVAAAGILNLTCPGRFQELSFQQFENPVDGGDAHNSGIIFLQRFI